jgi:hypothetical protein
MAEDIENGSTKGDATAGNAQLEVTEEEYVLTPQCSSKELLTRGIVLE